MKKPGRARLFRGLVCAAQCAGVAGWSRSSRLGARRQRVSRKRCRSELLHFSRNRIAKVAVNARIVDEEERAELWPKLVEIYPPYEDYQEFAGPRRIPVISLDPR